MVPLSDIFSKGYLGRPYIIAEAGVNHNGSVDMALEIIECAAHAGADCVKFQAFSADQLVTESAPKASYQYDPENPSQSQYEMLKSLELDPENFALLASHCRQLQIDFMVTPFSIDWAKKLLEYDLTAFKVSSSHVTSLDFLEKLGNLGLPVILSTGMCDLDEVSAAVGVLENVDKLALLHCVSMYPTPFDKANLRAIKTLHAEYNVPVGFSDHTVETITGSLAVAAGAVILEKHFTLDKVLPGPDHSTSLTPDDFKQYVQLVSKVTEIMGDGIKQPAGGEYAVRDVARLSLAAACDIAPGTIITDKMLTAKRPGTGISPADKHKIVGQKSRCEIEKGELIYPDAIEA